MGVGTLRRYGLAFSNVVNNGTATNRVTRGRTIEAIRLELGGTDFQKSHIARLIYRVNAKPIVDLKGEELDKILAYRGAANDAAFFDIPFADYSMLSEADRQVGAFDTNPQLGIGEITSEIQVVGADSPVLKSVMIESANQKVRDKNTGKTVVAPTAGLMTKFLRYPYSVANGGQLSFDMPKGFVIKRLYILSANMTNALVRENSLTVHESSKAQNEYDQRNHKRFPQTGMYVIDFAVDGNASKVLNTKESDTLEWLFDFSGADSGFVIAEVLDKL